MKEEFRCPHCGSSQTRGRIKTKDWYCNTCMKSFEIKKEEEDGAI